MSTDIKHRSELIFLYDVSYANPNGDPLDGNRPRMDEETGHCLVTDVRLKRTVRDFLIREGFDGTSDKGDIFIRDEDGMPVTGAQRSKSYNDKNEFKEKFIDVRMFGGVSAVEKKKFNLTGAVQLGMGKSLHPVHENFIKGTGAFATKVGAEQKTFREEYNITYALVAFHGVINENAAKETGLTLEDVDWLLKDVWQGTKDLLSRSKKGHMPRLLVKVDYTDGYFIGDLLDRISLDSKGKEPVAFDSPKDYSVNVTHLNAALKKAEKLGHLTKVSVLKDDFLELSEDIYKSEQLELN